MKNQVNEAIKKEIKKEIDTVLSEKYGNIKIKCIKDGIVEITLSPDIATCPNSKLEIVDTVEKIIKKSISDFKRVVLINDI